MNPLETPRVTNEKEGKQKIKEVLLRLSERIEKRVELGFDTSVLLQQYELGLDLLDGLNTEDEKLAEFLAVNDFAINPEAETEAFKFHQGRFEKESAAHNERGIIKRTLERALGTDPRNLKPLDIAHEEALRENDEFKRKQSLEYKEQQEDLNGVIDVFRLKRDHPESEEAKAEKTLVIMWGGGKKAAYCSGQLTAMLYMGYQKTVDEFRAISGAVLPAMFFVSAGGSHAKEGTSILYGRASDKQFFNPARFRQMLDITYMTQGAREGETKLDTDAVMRSHTKVMGAISYPGERKQVWVDAKTLPDMLRLVEVSGNVPFNGQGIEINGQAGFDGAFGEFDLEEVVKESGATTVLILTNNPYQEISTIQPSEIEEIISRIADISKNIPLLAKPTANMAGMVKKQIEVTREYRIMLDTIANKRGKIKTADGRVVKFGVINPRDNALTATTMDRDAIRTSIYDGARDMFMVFGEPIQDIKLFNPEREEERNERK